VSINNDVLSEVSLTSKTVVVWWRWLVNGPVVEWWVGNWVLDLSELDTGGLLLLELNFIWANDDLHVELSIVHGIGHEGWDNMNWDSLSLGKSNSNWCWLVGNEVLQVSSGDVSIHELEKTISIGLLGKSDGDWGWLVSDKVLEVTSGDVGIHKLEETISIGLLGKGDGDWCWLISDKVLQVSSGDVGIHELEEAISIGLLGKSDGDWGWLVGDEVLEVSSGDVGVHKLEEAISIGLLGKGNGNWGWLIGNEVLEVSSGDIGVHELEEAIGIRLLGKSNGNWCWLVGDEVLKVSSGDVGIHKFEEAIGIGLLRVELNKSLGDWGISVLDEVNESRLGHVLTVKLSNLDLSLMVLLGPVGGLVINGVVSIIIWETLVEDLLEGLATSEGISNVGSGSLWDSLDHDGKGDVVVVGDVLLLISGSLKDRVEGVVSNNLSERLEGHGLNNILGVGWVNLEGDGLDFINWDIGGLSESIEWIGLGSDKVGLGWDSGNTNWGSLGVLFVVVLVVMLVVGLRL